MAFNLFNLGPVQEVKTLDPVSIIKGVTFGIIFGLIGTIPWILATNAGWFVSFLGYLIGLATFKGFVFGAGYMHKIGKLTIIGVIIVAVPLAMLIETFLYGMKLGLPVGFVLANTPGVFFDNLGANLGNMLLGYLFAFLGVYRFIIPRKRPAQPQPAMGAQR